MVKKLARNYYRTLISAALIASGIFQLVAPVLAEGTLAGTNISNQATATYNDPEDINNPLTTVSNTVTVIVAEVAGITVTPVGIENVTASGQPVLPNHELFFDFEVTNVGNAASNIFVPDLTGVNISETATDTTGSPTAGVTQVQYSTDGGTTFTDVTVGGQFIPTIPAGDSIIVRIPVTVDSDADAGGEITVTLGNTDPIGGQNEPLLAGGAIAGNADVSTQDSDDTTAPSNGEREASAQNTILVNAQPIALATIFKSRTAYDNAGTVPLNDDTLTYDLSLQVEASAPPGSPGIVAADLTGTDINLDGATVSRILVSDAIPEGTVIVGTPVAPADWTPVYSIDNPALSGLAPNDPAVPWTTARPGVDTDIKRVGFVYTGGTTITRGDIVEGFSFQVVTTNVPAEGQTIENIAQVFGQTEDGAGTGTGLGDLVYDESGDQNPNNFNDDGTPPADNTPTDGVPDQTVDEADPNSSDNDPDKDNQGTGPGGEVNVFNLLPPGAILNGPDAAPEAIGPTDNNDDFTNQAVTPLNLDGNNQLDAAVTETFTNTVNNPGTNPITDILLAPKDIDGGLGNILPTDIPDGTIVEIVFGNQNAIYEYDNVDDPNGVFTLTGGTGPVRINDLPAGTSVDYTVNVTLPVGTDLSTAQVAPNADPAANPELFGGYPVPIVAFSDTGTIDGEPNLGEQQNTTINQIYVGYLRLVKEARILNSDGSERVGFTTDLTGQQIGSQEIIEYRITYTNISEAQNGTGNVILNAENVQITEDGTIDFANDGLVDPTGSDGNNWALDTGDKDSDGDVATSIDTSNVQGQATASQGTITFTPSGDQSGPDQVTDVTVYTNDVGTVPPQTPGSFTFQRRVN
ncbi:MAG: hypothetical protein F6K58_14730 [Symploca sp. SIO2E9]|nr:hypothetical protein [Symploca sp. SIO2E9]